MGFKRLFFIKPDLSNYGYTFSQALFDFDNFIVEFWGNVAFFLSYSRIFTNLYIKTFRRSRSKRKNGTCNYETRENPRNPHIWFPFSLEF